MRSVPLLGYAVATCKAGEVEMIGFLKVFSLILFWIAAVVTVFGIFVAFAAGYNEISISMTVLGSSVGSMLGSAVVYLLANIAQMLKDRPVPPAFPNLPPVPYTLAPREQPSAPLG